jgi:hypothetical protein
LKEKPQPNSELMLLTWLLGVLDELDVGLLSLCPQYKVRIFRVFKVPSCHCVVALGFSVRDASA